MLKITNSIPVRTRLPFAAWVIAGVIALASLVTTEAHVVRDVIVQAQHLDVGAPASQVLASVW